MDAKTSRIRALNDALRQTFTGGRGSYLRCLTAKRWLGQG